MDISRCLPARRQCAGETKRSWLRAALARLRLWHRRARDRRALLELDPRLCRDIGLTIDQVRHEAAKPFWRE